MSNEDGASEHARRDVLLAAVRKTEGLVDLEDLAHSELVTEGVQAGARHVECPLLGDDDLELLATAVGNGDSVLSDEPADVTGLEFLDLHHPNDGTGDKDQRVVWVCQAAADVGGEVGCHVGTVKTGLVCRYNGDGVLPSSLL